MLLSYSLPRAIPAPIGIVGKYLPAIHIFEEMVYNKVRICGNSTCFTIMHH